MDKLVQFLKTLLHLWLQVSSPASNVQWSGETSPAEKKYKRRKDKNADFLSAGLELVSSSLPERKQDEIRARGNSTLLGSSICDNLSKIVLTWWN